MAEQLTRSDWVTYKRLMAYVWVFWPYFLLSVVGFLLYSSAQVALADLMQFIVDTISGDLESDKGLLVSLLFDKEAEIDMLQAKVVVVSTLVVLGVTRGLGFFLGSYYINYVSGFLVHNLRCDIFNQLLKVPSSEYDHHSSGFLISKIIYNVEQVTGAATNAIQVIIREGLFAIGLLLYLFYMNWKLSLLFLIILPFIAVVVIWVGKRFRKISTNIQDAMGGVTQVAGETINAYQEVRIFGGEDYEHSRFTGASSYNRLQTLKLAFYRSLSPPIIQLPLIAVLAALIWFALGFASEMTPGQFVAFLTAAMLLPKPIRQLSGVNSIVQRALAASDDIFDFLDLNKEPDFGDYETDSLEGRIELSGVCFSYSEEAGPVLKNINLTIEPGQTVALVGLSGSGKSTLINLLTRFYNHDKGAILLDGVDVNDYRLTNLRHHISLVTQSVTLFNDTIYNNIAYGGMKDASYEDVVAAARAAHAMEFIEKQPEGLNTLMGEDGTLLSGGQRQRIAIARALLKDSPILILDEATSALDNKAEFHIQEALKTAMENRTTIVIAHRLSTIENADLIVVMEDGEIVEQGRHQQLLEQGQ